jgi:hypothetical protein
VLSHTLSLPLSLFLSPPFLPLSLCVRRYAALIPALAHASRAAQHQC